MTTSHPIARITVVSAPACHFCHDAHEALVDLAAQHPISVETVEADSEEGRALISQHRPAMMPLVLLDGQFFSTGRLPRRKLTKMLASREAVKV